MSKPTVQRLVLGYLAAGSLLVGLWAQLAPRSFFEEFPGLGGAWVAVDGPYNEHLVRDVGGLNLALAAVLIAAAITLSRPLIATAAVAALVYGVPHLLYHVFNTENLAGPDIVTSLGALAVNAGLPLAVLLTTRSDDEPEQA